MKTSSILKVMAAILIAPSVLCAASNPVTPEMSGHWEGKAQIIVSWTVQRTLPVSIDIKSDGTVTGKVGDASLANARFKRNRGWLGRKLNLKTDYIITGDLKGAVIAAEGINRKGVMMPLNFSSNAFKGAVHTSGTHVGNKQRMVLSAGVTLTP